MGEKVEGAMKALSNVVLMIKMLRREDARWDGVVRQCQCMGCIEACNECSMGHIGICRSPGTDRE